MSNALIGLFFYRGYCFADVGDVRPQKEEIDKAPATPAVVEIAGESALASGRRNG